MKIREEEFMKQQFRVLPVLAMALCISALPIYAQSSDVSTKTTTHLWYDMAKEITLTGTVISVVKTPARGTGALIGSHLMMQTNAGPVDASLGSYALKGQGALSISAGDSVRVNGIMKTVRGKQVFIARVVTTNGHAYVLRNEHGIVYLHSAQRGTATSAAKGGTL
jgi:hypothetical protein